VEATKQDTRKARLKKWLAERFPSTHDLIDVEAEYDGELSYLENREAILAKFSTVLGDSAVQPTKAALEEERARASQSAARQARAEEQAAIDAWKRLEPRTLLKLPGLFVAENHIRMAVLGHVNGCVVIGPGGCGKTKLVEAILAEQNIQPHQYERTSGYMTPLMLYDFLYRNNGKLLVMDDVDGLLTDAKAVSFLKAAIWEAHGKRMICYSTSAEAAQGLPRQFEFTGRLIVLANRLPKKQSPDMAALVSRCAFAEVRLSPEQVKAGMEIIAQNPYADLAKGEREAVLYYLLPRVTPATPDITFRSLIFGFEYLRYAKKAGQGGGMMFVTDRDGTQKPLWMELVDRSIIVDEELEFIQHNINLSRADLARLYAEQFGKSRRTLFNKLKLLGVTKR
jgi:hypothetical protein